MNIATKFALKHKCNHCASAVVCNTLYYCGAVDSTIDRGICLLFDWDGWRMIKPAMPIALPFKATALHHKNAKLYKLSEYLKRGPSGLISRNVVSELDIGTYLSINGKLPVHIFLAKNRWKLYSRPSEPSHQSASAVWHNWFILCGGTRAQTLPSVYINFCQRLDLKYEIYLLFLISIV